MSKKEVVVDARLSGYAGPIPVSVDALQGLVDKFSGLVNCKFLGEACECIRGYRGQSRVITSDRYCWFRSLNFSIGTEMVVIFIPGFRYVRELKCNQPDRPIAVYTMGEIPSDKIVALLEKVSENLNEVMIKATTIGIYA